MATRSKDEERQLIELRLSPRRNAPEKLHALVQHFMNNGTVWAVTEGDMGPVRVSKDLARKVNGLVRSGKLTWVLNRTDLPSEVRLRTAEKELGPHKSELYYFGVRLRDRLKLPRPDQVVGTSPKFSPDDLGLWGGPGIDETIRDQEVEAVEEKWGFDAYDARSHPVFDDFRWHLAEAGCGSELVSGGAWLRSDGSEHPGAMRLAGAGVREGALGLGAGARIAAARGGGHSASTDWDMRLAAISQ